MIRAFRYRPTSVRYSEDLPSPVMLQLLPRTRVVAGGLPDASGARPWELPELD